MGDVEPRIAPLVEAVRKAGFATFSSCEGHLEDEGAEHPRLPSVGFYASEADARRVHSQWLKYRAMLTCSWVLRASFVIHRETRVWALGWTLENWGVKEGETEDFWRRTVEATWNTDIAMLVTMFEELASD